MNDGPRLPPIAALLDAAVREGVTPAAQCTAMLRGRVVHRSAHGAAFPDGPSTTTDTLFDVASVTKVVATTSLALVLAGRGALPLDEPAARLLPSFAAGGKASITARHLLAHTSGLPAWRPLFVRSMRDPQAGALWPLPAALLEPERARAFARSRALVREAALAEPAEAPVGRRCAYSDLGFLALGELLARAGGDSLDRLCARHVFAPLGLRDTFFVDHARDPGPALPAGRSFAATGLTRPREPAPGQEGLFPVPAQPADRAPGTVDDDHAYALGGVAGHAGLFSTADDVARFGAALLEELEGAGRLAPAALVRSFCAPDPHPEGPPRALGFDLPSGAEPSCGARFGRGPLGAVGHLGFTGCSLWIDRDRALSVALLTNRVHLGRANLGIRSLRPRLHDTLVDLLDPPEGAA